MLLAGPFVPFITRLLPLVNMLLNTGGVAGAVLNTAMVPDALSWFVHARFAPSVGRMMVLNEPETSLHPDLLPALARLIIRASEQCQVWVVSHARRLISALQEDPQCNCIVLEKNLGQTGIVGQRMLDEPAWYWPD